MCSLAIIFNAVFYDVIVHYLPLYLEASNTPGPVGPTILIVYLSTSGL